MTLTVRSQGFLLVNFIVLGCVVGLLPATHAGPLDDLSCSGLKRVGFESPISPPVGAGPLQNQGVALDVFYQGDFGLFVLQDEDNAGDGAPGVFDYLMSGWTYRETVYCEEVVCPVVDELDRRIDPVEAEFGAFVGILEAARDAGCLDDPSRPVDAEHEGP